MSTTWTIDQLARRAGTTARQVRAFQTQGLLPHPRLVGRTGFYDPGQLDRLRAIQRLQRQGFSLAGIARLLHALDAGSTLEHVVGLRGTRADRIGTAEVPATDVAHPRAGDPPRSDDRERRREESDASEAFEGWPDTPEGQLLSVIPTTLHGLSIAS